MVLRGYLQWGDAVADRLNGMYAFAIWDSRDRKLVMIRDRMGIKPFYFYRTSDGVLFGSEPKAILANPLAKRVVDVDGLRELLRAGQDPQAGACGRACPKSSPGTIVTVDERGIRERTYWRLESKLHTDDRDTTVAHVRELLDDIVRRQLVADVPECVLLSGGLDSSAITALSARELKRPGPHVRRRLRRPGRELQARRDAADHGHAVRARRGRARRLRPHRHRARSQPAVRTSISARKVVGARDIPMGLGDMDASLYLLFKAIRQQSTVALSGESADEIFGGYRQFHDPRVQQTDAFPWIADRRRVPSTPPARCSRRLCVPPSTSTPTCGTATPRPSPRSRRLDGEDDFTHRMRVMSYLHLTRFVRILLDRKDRMSMAVGLEVRVPFCDHRLVEYVYNTPWSLKTYDGREKSLLRGAARDVLPESVVDRVKSPYPSTSDPQYGAAIQAHAKDLYGSGDDLLFSLIDPAKLEHLIGLDPHTLATRRQDPHRAGAGPGGVDRHVQADDRLLICSCPVRKLVVMRPSRLIAVLMTLGLFAVGCGWSPPSPPRDQHAGVRVIGRAEPRYRAAGDRESAAGRAVERGLTRSHPRLPVELGGGGFRRCVGQPASGAVLRSQHVARARHAGRASVHQRHDDGQ